MIPEYWRNFITNDKTIGREFEIAEDDDLSGLRADLKIMNIEQSISEAAECYSGIAAIKKGEQMLSL